MPAERRRSERRKVPRKRYTVDPLEGYEGFISDSEHEETHRTTKRRKRATDHDDDEDFGELDALAAQEVDEGDNDDDEVATVSSGDELHADDEDIHSDNSSINAVVKQRKRTRRGDGDVDASTFSDLPAFDTRPVKVSGTSTIVRSRGVAEILHNEGRTVHLRSTYGTGSEDLAAYLQGRKRWFKQVTLPTRQPDAQDTGGLSYSGFNPPMARQRESEQYQRWYLKGGGKSWFLQNQTSYEPTSTEQESILTTARPFKVLLGPVNGPKLLSLKSRRPVQLQDAWGDGIGENNKPPRLGWIVNLGGKIQCLEWVPHQDRHRQFLSVVVLQDLKPTSGEAKEVQNDAFTPKPRYRSSMQIWEFRAERGAEIGARPDLSSKPFLRAVLTWDWGDLMRMSWCPSSLGQTDNKTSKGTLRLGLFGGVWTDGRLRVLDLAITNSKYDKTQYLHISKAAFETLPPDSVCTCIAWLSSSSLVAGCANGAVGIWNIRSLLKTEQKTENANPRPVFYHELHGSYVISVATGYPSRPHLLFTYSLDGTFRMTDCRAPTQDYCHSIRVRVAQGPIAWHDACQLCFFADESCSLKSSPARRFFATTQMMRMNSFGTAIAMSPVHPFVLCASLDGTVWATNPLRRARTVKVDCFAQIWFKHEWRRGMKEETEGKPLLQQPLSRFTEGYELVKVGTAITESDNDDGSMQKDASVVTVYEEQTAVTQVCWNPNLLCGTWAAAGMADGLLRVEDLSLN